MTEIRLRRGTTTTWAAANPILSDGEAGWDSTAQKFKIGDGVTSWSSLPYMVDAALNLKANLAGPTFTGTVGGITKAMVGLGNVDNTSNASAPVSTAQQTALDLKANLAGPTFTGTVGGITATMVGLGSVNNTSDAAKPVSTAQQTALNLKANLASPTFTGTVSGITDVMVGLGNVDNTSDAAKPVSTAQQTALNLKANLAGPTFTGTVSGITKAMVGLGNVDNTSNVNAPVSTAQQTALNLKINSADEGVANGVATLDATGKVPTAQLPTAQIGNSLIGTYAARPSAAGTAAGTIYYATNTLESYRSTGAAWQVIAAGSELGSAELRSTFSDSSGNWVDVTGLTVTFVAGERPVRIALTADLSTAAGNVPARARIVISGTTVMGEINAWQPYADKWDTRTLVVRRSNLTAGTSYTAKVQMGGNVGVVLRMDGNTEKAALLTVEGV